MKRLIYIDGQDKQDYLARGFSVLSSTIALASKRIPKPRSQAHGSLHTRTRASSQSASCAAATRPVYPVYPVYRCSQIQPTGLTGHWSLFPTGHEGSLFHPRMIRPAGRGPANQDWSTHHGAGPDGPLVPAYSRGVWSLKIWVRLRRRRCRLGNPSRRCMVQRLSQTTRSSICQWWVQTKRESAMWPKSRSSNRRLSEGLEAHNGIW